MYRVSFKGAGGAFALPWLWLAPLENYKYIATLGLCPSAALYNISFCPPPPCAKSWKKPWCCRQLVFLFLCLLLSMHVCIYMYGLKQIVNFSMTTSEHSYILWGIIIYESNCCDVYISLERNIQNCIWISEYLNVQWITDCSLEP